MPEQIIESKVLSEEEVNILTAALEVYADAWEEDEDKLALILGVLGKVTFFASWMTFSQQVIIGRADRQYPTKS